MGPVLILVFFVEGVLVQVLLVSGCLGRLVGGIGGFAQTQIRALLGYSSIGHGGWLIVGGLNSVVGGVFYFIMYFFIMAFLFYLLSIIELRRCRSLKGSRYLWFLGLGFLTLAGLPPRVGFSMK